MSMNSEPLLKIHNVTKRFPGIVALDQVSISLFSGEILGILGENGAGKSTLIKIISGIYDKDEGTIYVDGKEIRFTSPSDSLKSGIRTIYQEMTCFDSLSVAENVFAGDPLLSKHGFVDWNEMNGKAREILAQFGSDIDPHSLIEELSIVERQIVEIVKALRKNARILIMDEPTSALQEKDVAKLYEIIRKLKSNNTAIIYISHRIDEIFDLTDRIIVLRDGKKVGEVITKHAKEKEIVELIIGKALTENRKRVRPDSLGPKLLEVRNLSYSDKLKNISFDLHAGEIIAFFGLLGSGVYQLLQILFGYYKGATGSTIISGRNVVIDGPIKAKEHGIGYVPFSRKDEGLGLNLGISQNITAANIENIGKGIFINKKMEGIKAADWIERVNIKASDKNAVVNTLSGGNQQKVVIARWLECASTIFLLGDPMRGVDIGAKAEIFEIIQKLCSNGAGIILISSDVKEVVTYSDRVIVLKNGEIVGRFDSNSTTTQELLHLAAL